MKASLPILLVVFFFSCTPNLEVQSQNQEKKGELRMDFETYEPVSTLVVPEHLLTQSKYPFIDVHNHQWSMPSMDLERLIAEMDKLNMGVLVNLSGRGRGSREHLTKSLENVNAHFPKRFIIFTNVNFGNLDDPNWEENISRQLEADVAAGANGLKVYKSLGLRTKDKFGNRVKVNDPRLDIVWATCGKLGIPVLIHTADPAPFWLPHDEKNERWLELKQRPGRKQDPEKGPTFEELIAEQHDIFRKHPNTKFINAHLGWYGNNLAKLGELMDTYPNMYTEIGAVLAELGRQPRAAKAFLTQYQDRVMFGKDAWNPAEYHVYFRCLETADEYFDYYRRRHAHWKIYGLYLDDEVLKKIYYKNAISVIPGIDAAQFPE
ncbi:MAG: amidohydrolase family protein [Bacteroidota bacterium]